MKQSRIEPPLNNEGTPHYYNDEWNQVDKSPSYETQYKNDPRDEDHEDFVDYYPTPKVDTTYYDDYEDYGH